MRAFAASLALAALLTPPHALGGAHQQDPAAEQVAQLLAGAVREGRGGEELTVAVAGLGAPALPAAFQALVSGRVRPDTLDETWIELGRPQTQAVIAAIARSPAARGFFAGLVKPETSVTERSIALRILADMATLQDLDLCLALATGDGSRDVRAPLEKNLLRIVANEEKAVSALGACFAEQPPALYAPVIRAIGSAGSMAALQQLAELLEKRPESDALLLCEIARLGGLLPHPIDSRTCTSVRRFLSRSDPQVLAAAVYAVGRLEDHEAAEQLVDLLDSDLEHVRTNAHGVLRALSGKHFPLDQTRWETWYRKESEWWRHDAPFHKAELGSGAQFQVAAALRELSVHRLYRHELAPEVARCLQRSEVDLVRLACATLGQLGSRTVLPELVQLLEQGDSETAPAAERALERITGEHLRGAEAWRALVN